MSLPTEIWFQILLQRSPVEILRLCRTNQFFQLICRDRSFWRQSLSRHIDLDPYIFDLFFTYPLYQNVSANIVVKDLILALNNQDNSRLLRWAVLSNFTPLISYLYEKVNHITMKSIISLALQYNRPQVVADLTVSLIFDQLPEYITMAIRARNLTILETLISEEQERGQSIRDLTDYLEIATEQLEYLRNRRDAQANELREAQQIIDYLQEELSNRL